MTRDELLLRITRIFAHKRPELLSEQAREHYAGVTREQYDEDRGALARGPWKWPMHRAQAARHGDGLRDAAARLRPIEGNNPLSEVIGGMIDYFLSPGAVRTYGRFVPVEFCPGTPGELSAQLLGVLGYAVEEFLVPGVREEEWRAEHSRIELYEGGDPAGDKIADTGEGISVAATQEECEVVALAGARATEAADAGARVAEMLAGYPKFVVDLAHAAGTRGDLGGWAADAGVTPRQARRWVADLKRELGGEGKAPYSWVRLARKYGHGDLSAEPGKSHWVYGARTDAVNGCTVTGWIHSGEVPSGSPWFEDAAVASAYWWDRRGR